MACAAPRSLTVCLRRRTNGRPEEDGNGKVLFAESGALSAVSFARPLKSKEKLSNNLQVQAVKSDETITRADKKPIIQELKQAADTEIQGVLSPEQYEKLLLLKANRKGGK